MALTDSFYEAVRSGNVRRVRIMMKDSLLVDPTFDEFDEMEEEAENMDGLYDEHDGGELIEDKSLWNDEYMNKLMVKVLFNFSHERVDHLKEVVSYLRPAESIDAVRPYKASDYSDDESSSEQYDHLGVKIGAGAAVGALIGGVIAAVADAPVVGLLGGIAAGALLGGATATIIAGGGKDE